MWDETSARRDIDDAPYHQVTGVVSLGSIRPGRHDHLGDGAPDRLENLYRGRGGAPVWKEGRGVGSFRIAS